MELSAAQQRAGLRREIFAEAEKIEKSRLKLLPDEALVRLALAPYCPAELAEVGLGLSTGAAEVLEAGVRKHLLQMGSAHFPWTEPVFWMEKPERDLVLREIAVTHKREFVTQQLAAAARSLVSASGERLQDDLSLTRWVELAEVSESQLEFAQLLARKVGDALGASQKTEALRWIETAEPFAESLGGGFEAAIAAAKRRYELFHRQQYDKVLLRNYYVRDESDQTFRDLLSDPQRWALHYVGSGGFGKTMLIRHIAIDLAKSCKAAVSRVDFDYLNPEYPDRNPGLLLLALAEEFRLQARTGSERVFDRLQEACSNLHRTISGAHRQGRNLRISAGDSGFQHILVLFNDALFTLPEEQRPVLILDTCEELAKVNPGGTVPRNVAETFAVLEQLHALNPDIRVIFSGRRPLPKKDYLRVHNILGFTADDARRFLGGFKGEGDKTVEQRLIPGIMRLSGSETGPEPRYNPYDLDSYAKWVSTDPDMTEAALAAAGPHLYVTRRIIDRLKPWVREILPALALLGRFDKEIAKSLLGHGDAEDRQFDELVSQEWINADSAATIDTWRIDDLLRTRLLRYYREQNRNAYQSSRAMLSRILPAIIKGRKFTDLTPQVLIAYFDVALDNPSAAAEWWDEIEQRIAADGQWQWAAELLRFLNIEDWGTEQRKWFAPALQATKAAAMLHAGGEDTRPLWQEVQRLAKEHPQPLRRKALQFRTLCGLRDPAAFALAPQPMSDQHVASALSLAESLVEQGLGQASGDAVQAFLDRVSHAPELNAFAALLSAQLAARSERKKEALDGFHRALRLCSDASSKGGQIWLDWIRPAHLGNRILLELACFSSERFTELADHRAEALFTGPLEDIDSERLASAWLVARHARVAFANDPLAERFRALYDSSLALVREPLRCDAHRAYGPFFVTLLEAQALSGELEQALRLFRDLSGSDLVHSNDVTLAIDRAMTRLIRSLRLESEGYAIPQTVLLSPEVEDIDLVAVTGALNLAPPENLLLIDETPPDARHCSRPELDQVELAFLKNRDEIDTHAAEARARARSDDLGCVQAILLRALSFARIGNRVVAQREVDRARGPYEVLARRVPGIPDWEEIVAAAEKATGSALLRAMGDKPSPWRPLITRLLACRVAPTDDDLADWVLDNDALLVEDRRRIPVELQFLAGSRVADVRPAAASVSRLARFYSVLGAVFFPAVGLVILGGALWAAYSFLYLPLLNATVGKETAIAPGWHFLLFPLFLLGVGLLIRLLSHPTRGVTAAYAWLIGTEVEIHFPEPLPDRNWPLRTPCTLRRDVRLVRVLSLPVRRFDLPPLDLEPYRNMANKLLPHAGLSLLPPAVLAPGNIELKVTVDAESAAAPWEFLLGFGSDPKGTAFFVRRVTREHRLRKLRRWGKPVDVLIWGELRTRRWTQSWGEHFEARSMGHEHLVTRMSGPLSDVDPEARVGVLLIVGTPLDSNAGLVISMWDASPQESGNLGYSLRPEQIAASFSSLRLCILQCPTAEFRRRLDSDRIYAAIAKRMGAEIFRSGVPIVIVVPVLDEDALSAFLDEIQKVLLRRPKNAVPVLERAITSFRRSFLEKDNSEDTAEVMADICLYARDEVSLRSEG